jgi:hypothetical protein
MGLVMPLVALALLIATAWIAGGWYARRRRALQQFSSTKNDNAIVKNHVTKPPSSFANEKATVEVIAKVTAREEAQRTGTEPGNEIFSPSFPARDCTNDADANLASVPEPNPELRDKSEDTPDADEMSLHGKVVTSELVEAQRNVEPVTSPINAETSAICPPVAPDQNSPEFPRVAIPNIPTRAPEYRPLRPVPSEPKSQRSNSRNPRISTSINNEVNLGVRIRLVFQARRTQVVLSMVLERNEGMPLELQIDGTLGVHPLSQMAEGYFADITPNDFSQALRNGVDVRGREAQHRRFRWVLGGRELYVLTPDGDGRLSGFVSTPRLLLNEEHLVLATASLETEVRAALETAGCPASEVWDENIIGVPTGWRLFLGVKPTRAVPARNKMHLLNALCPLADLQPHFIGGIRLERRTWLFGYPPKIHFSGDLNGIEVKLDDKIAVISEKGTVTAPGWDEEGEHLLWFGGQTVTYALHRANEEWRAWPAHDFGAGVTICGASLVSENDAKPFFVRVPRGHPIIIGAYPGEIATVPLDGCRGESWFVRIPFAPVWALPADPLHADKSTMQLHLVGEPRTCLAIHDLKSLRSKKKASYWCRLINDAGRKHLAVAPDQIDLWRSYRDCARRLLPRIRV